MSLKGRLESELGRLVDAISSIEGVVAVILFGSYAKGDFDEYSDYDLLVIFKDRDLMWRGWDDLFRKVGALRVLAHIVPKSLDEFWGGEPTFLAEVLSHGRLLYGRHPFEVPAVYSKLMRADVVIYDMKGLDQRAKARLVYRLYGRKSPSIKGLVDELGGVKLSDGCVLVPAEGSRSVKEAIEECGARVKVLKVYVERTPPV